MRFDLRRYARQTNTRLVLGALVLVFLVGDGLIYLIYGRNAALMGLLCLLTALVPCILVVLVLLAIDWFMKRHDRV